MTHIFASKQTIIGSDNGLSPDRRQAIIWTNAGILLMGPWKTNFFEILSEIRTLPFIKMRLKTSSAKWRPFCLGLNGLKERMVRCQWRIWLKSIGTKARDTPHKSTAWIILGVYCAYDLYQSSCNIGDAGFCISKISDITNWATSNRNDYIIPLLTYLAWIMVYVLK